MDKKVLSSFVLSLLCSLFCGLAPAGAQAGHWIFFDDFSGDLEKKWISFLRPGPRPNEYRGNPAPSLKNDFKDRKKNGVMSKRSFFLVSGTVIRCDMYISPRSGNAWVEGAFGLPRTPDDFRRGVWPEWLVGMSYNYIGNPGWSRRPLREEGTLICYLVNEDGDLEINRIPFRNRYLDSWHTYEITVRNDGFIEFRIDGGLIYYSRKRLSYGYKHLPLLLGQRSGGKGKVYHDNVEVLSYKREELIK
ncbi:MAG: hypothetical protein RAO92_06005 [Candidatus Euphemobacter frigidus]|nr:hypothetical protein [Candidatus Euphemobacter frigidus]MDP8275938.1 hypothetical protein [Candidatus Euphemobacter frigidus]